MSETETANLWISKYALGDKIRQMECKLRPDGTAFTTDGAFLYFTLGRDAHRTREEAVAAAKKLREKRIASLRKQIAKLEKLEFGE